jgi:hypothetical protein
MITFTWHTEEVLAHDLAFTLTKLENEGWRIFGVDAQVWCDTHVLAYLIIYYRETDA